MTRLGLSSIWVLVGSGILTLALAGARALAFLVPALIMIAAAGLVVTVAWQARRPREARG